MNSDISSRLTPLSDGRPGLRATITTDVRQPIPSPRGEGQGEGNSIRDNSCNSCLDFVSSDPTLDRYHEIISPAGWQLATYQKNPVFQNAHQYGDIIFTLGRALITEVRQGDPSIPQSAIRNPHLYQRIQFAVDANPMAKIAYSLYAGKFLSAVSVGFIPLRWQDADGTEHGTRNTEHAPRSNALTLPRFPDCRRSYLEQELLEVSAVAIPANPNALALALEKCDLKETAALLTDLAYSHRNMPAGSPSPWGEGRGEGELSSIQHPASSIRSSLSILHPPSSLPTLLDLAREIRSLLAHI